MKTQPTPPRAEVSRSADELLTPAQICEKLKISNQTLRRLRMTGRIGSYRIFGGFRYDFEEVKAALLKPVDQRPNF